MLRDRRLKLDVDSRHPLPVSVLTARLRAAGYRPVALGQQRSPSGRGYHCWLVVTPLPQTAMELVALQCLCGSDLAREAHNVERARAVDRGTLPRFWVERFNVLYR